MTTTPAAPLCSTICDPRYLTLTTVPSGRILAVAPGSNCQAFVGEAAAWQLLVSYGPGLGYGPTSTPSLALPAHTIPTPVTSESFPFLLIAEGGGATTPWKSLAAPTGGNYFLTAKNGVWSFTDAGQIPGLNSIFTDAGSSAQIEALGFIQTGTSGGSPVFETRKLVGTGTGETPLVLALDTGTGRYVVKAANLGGDIKYGSLKFVTLGEVDGSGVATTGGFSIRPDSGITQANIYGLVYDSGTGKVYRAAASTIEVIEQVTASGAITNTGSMQSVPGHLQFAAKDFHYPDTEITFTAKFNATENVSFGLFQDGSLIHTWTTANGVETESLYSASWIVKSLSLASHQFDIRLSANSAFNVTYSCATMKTLR